MAFCGSSFTGSFYLKKATIKLKRKLQSILHAVIYQRYKEGRNYKRVSFKIFLAPLSLTSCFPNTTGRRPAFLEAEPIRAWNLGFGRPSERGGSHDSLPREGRRGPGLATRGFTS